jgi:pimeloyl-ACP methyl ester carboxylesterase
LAPSYVQPDKADCQMWCDPRNGSAAAFQQGLVDLGAKSGYPELGTIPWALWGHSGGGPWAGAMVLLHPDRVAAAWLRSGVPLLKGIPGRPTIKTYTLPDAALRVPVLCNLGTKEGVTVQDDRFAGVWPATEGFFHAVRGKGGLIGVAVDPLSSHECGNQRYFAMPWLDACLSARLPQVRGQQGDLGGEGGRVSPVFPRSRNARPSPDPGGRDFSLCCLWPARVPGVF